MATKLLSNKTALITGASRGIGQAIALKFAENGANIAFTYLKSQQAAQELEEKIKTYGVQVKSYQSDAGNYSDCEKLVDQVLKDFNTIDICVNNAGISKDNLLLRLTQEQWDEVIQANQKSVFNMTKQIIKPMMKNQGGSIINMSSIIGIKGNAGQAAYAASKAAIIGFTKSIAQELGSRNIRCNAVAPGFIETDMTAYLQNNQGAEAYLNKIPLKRFGKTDDIANICLFLASDMSAYITGQAISVCGGLNM